MMKVLTVVTHPRKDSLTFAVANKFIEGLLMAGHDVEVLDLYRNNFNPVLWEEDEPDWSVEDQKYSATVQREIERMHKHDALSFIFPLWWWSMPGMLKGYIDRVWNYGVAYGTKKLHHQYVLWLSLAGAPIERFKKRQYDNMINHYFNIALADYCGIPNSKVALIYKTINSSPDYVESILIEAHNLGLNYANQ